MGIPAAQLLEKIKYLEHEVVSLKIALIKRKNFVVSQQPVSLEGIWEGIEITDEDIEASKASLFPKHGF